MADTGDELQLPLDIAFHGMESSAHIEHQVRRQAKKLERFQDKITHIRVAVESAHKGSVKAQLAVKVEVSIPGKMIVGQREGRPHEAVEHSDVYGVIREAFEVTVRRLEDYAGKHFNPQKAAAGSERDHRRATITRVDTERGHGMLETDSGQSLFFHAAAVKGDDLGALEPGMEVTYSLAEAEGAYGPEAKLVSRVVGGRGHTA